MSNCILCNGSDFYKYASVEEYGVNICKKCSLTKLNPLPTQKQLDILYKRTYREEYGNQDIVDKNVIKYEELRANKVSMALDCIDIEVNNIFDIGFSSGTLLNTLSKKFNTLNLSGIEFNEKYISYAKDKYHIKDENIFSSDIVGIDFKQKYDLITMVHVLEHTRNPKKVLDKIFKILSDKGYIYIEVPNLKTPYNNLKKKYFFFFHLYYFSDYTLKLLLELSGFKIIKKVVQNGTSIAYVCQKTNVMNETVLNKNEFNTVIRILRNYRYINYPIFLVRTLLVNIISFIGLKKVFIKIRKVFL